MRTIFGGLSGVLKEGDPACILDDFILLLVLRSQLRFDFEDFADVREAAGELTHVENVVTVDPGGSISPLVFFLDSDLGRFDDDDERFNSLLEDRLRDEELRRTEGPLFEDERLHEVGEG